MSNYDPSPYLASENGLSSNVTGAAVTGGFFRVVGGNPVLGRALAPSDDVIGAENVLVITHRLWQRRYAGAPDAIGRRLTVSERPFTIVGVMPPDFEYPLGVEAWMTLAASASTVANPAFREGVLRDVDLVARLRPGATVEQAESELSRLAPVLEAEAPPDALRGLRPVVRRYEDAVVADVRPALKFGRPDAKEPWRTVVGVARPTRYRELRSPRPTLYVPAGQFIDAAETLVLRTPSPVERVAGLVRERVKAVDPDVPVLHVSAFGERLRAPLSAPRFNALLSGLFGTAALLLAAIGLFAVASASVRLRLREMGLRLAIGAAAADVRGLVLAEGLRLAALGIAIGIGLAAAATGLLRGALVEVPPCDPSTLAAAALVVLAASGVACYVPAQAASRADPAALLRAE